LERRKDETMTTLARPGNGLAVEPGTRLLGEIIT
jgi:hypothetical protein